MTEAVTTTGAEQVRWDLSDLYSGLDDPALDRDLQQLIAMAEGFSARHQGKLAQTLGEAVVEQARMTQLATKLMAYLQLRRSTDAANAEIQQRAGAVLESWSRAEANHLTFFEHELVRISEETYASLCESDEHVRKHRPMLDHVRANRRYLLEENVERALVLRSPFGPGEWSDYVEEKESELRFALGDEELTLPQILHRISNDPERERRAEALKVFNQGLNSSGFERLMARALNVTAGAKALEDEERGYENPMSARNIGNRVDDATVKALHEAVAEEGARQARRYYQLLSAHLGLRPLAWSDRNASLPHVEQRLVPWQECVETVLGAYDSFSPRLRGCVQTMLDRRWVDAPPAPGKVGGAFNYSVLLPSGEARAYNLLNYQGSPRDVMTMAHEVGHGAHGMLAAKAQGPLMFRAPMAYAETASIFGEMTTFNYMLERTQNSQQRLALLMEKCSDHINAVVRQISFSAFEQRIHQHRRSSPLTPKDFGEHWMAVTRDFYGPDGDLFTYDHAGNLWCYVHHFLRPFYVYAYAFGELFTQSLFAVKDGFGSEFEPMYLDLLRAGGTRSAVELMQPFNLDPRDPSFWLNGIRGSIGRWLDEAEALSAELGVKV